MLSLMALPEIIWGTGWVTPSLGLFASILSFFDIETGGCMSENSRHHLPHALFWHGPPTTKKSRCTGYNDVSVYIVYPGETEGVWKD